MSHALPELADFVGVRVIGEVLIRFKGVVLVPAIVTTWREWPSYRTLLLQGEGPFIYYDRSSWVAGGEKRE